MRQQSRLPVTTMTVVLAFGIFVAAVGLSQDSVRRRLTLAPRIPGQSVTLLPSGRWLFEGGIDNKTPVGSGYILDNSTGRRDVLQAQLTFPRAWHTATVLSDGTVAMIGGVPHNGRAVPAVEQLDLEADQIKIVKVKGLTARSHHTATLLSDGTVLIVGGIGIDGKALGTAQLWNPKTNQISAVNGQLNTARSDHSAMLLGDGKVLIEGGVGADGSAVGTSEAYDVKSRTFSALSDESAARAAGSSSVTPDLSGTIPANGAKNVGLDSPISMRFSSQMQVETLTSGTIVLSSSAGNVLAHVVAAEGGMLAFLNPQTALTPNVTYTVTVSGAVGVDGIEMPTATFSFTTGNAHPIVGGATGAKGWDGRGEFEGNGVWIPTSDWKTHLAPSRWQALKPLMAKPGVTALSGQILTLKGDPLSHVTLQFGSVTALSDETGRFLLSGINAGKGVLRVTGSSADTSHETYGIFEIGLNINPRVTNLLGFTVWMPVLDMVHAVTLPSPTKVATTITSPLLPGLELHIPAGIVIQDDGGTVLHTVSMTPVPLDRPPFPLPLGVDVPIYFTIQPGAAYLKSTSGSGYTGAQLYYPNSFHEPPNTVENFWDYTADGAGWWVYGHGKVNADGTQVVPDPDVVINEFSGAMVEGPNGAPPGPNPAPPPGCPNGPDSAGDPVDCGTGLLIENHTDMMLRDIIPVNFIRTYRSSDTRSRPFGIGGTDNYEMFLVGDSGPWTYVDLILPNGARVFYPRIDGATGFPGSTTVYQNTSAPGPYYGSKVTYNSNCSIFAPGCFLLTLKDGTVYTFPNAYQQTNPALAALLSVQDRYGNRVNIDRDMNGNITQITSPNGRWLQFQHDASNRITQISDNIGRFVTYTYDNYSATGRPTCNSTGLLCAVTDLNGGVTSFTYDSGDRMLTMTDARLNTTFTNVYDTAGRVKRQTLADGVSVWQFGYTLAGR